MVSSILSTFPFYLSWTWKPQKERYVGIWYFSVWIWGEWWAIITLGFPVGSRSEAKWERKKGWVRWRIHQGSRVSSGPKSQAWTER